MIKLADIVIRRTEPTQLQLTWSFKNTIEDLNNYVLTIYRSEGPSTNLDEYEVAATGIPVLNYAFNDPYPNGRANSNTTWYYKFKIKNTETDQESVQPDDYAYMADEVPNFRWRKIYSLKKLVLERKSGRDFLLLKKRSWGQVKTEADFDPVLFVRKGLPDNTEFIDNYFFNPIRFKGMLGVTPSIKQTALWGQTSPGTVMFNTITFPPLEVGDIIIDPTKDNRYKVDRLRTVELLGFPVEQQAQMDLIHIDDEVYQIDTENY